MHKGSLINAGELYSFDSWSEGYFGIRSDGDLVCRPSRQSDTEISMPKLISEIEAQGLSLPVLVRFGDILLDRVRALLSAFANARKACAYSGGHTVVYPIKVNQQSCVVEQILHSVPGRVGLEAGSKPELMAVLAQTFHKSGDDDHETIICNGYKDREYIRLALIGGMLGKRVFIVIEQPEELDSVLEQAAELNTQARLGVRVRLASVAKGRWQNSGGEKAKFGLSASQVLQLIDRLKQLDCLSMLELLHCHMGSQVADIEHIRLSMHELARFYEELHRLGAAVRAIDVGGGLGVDYEGSASANEFSINYRFQSYADTVVNEMMAVCKRSNIPAPEIITESGRALTAHHAVLITNVVDVEYVSERDLNSMDHPYAQVIAGLVSALEMQQDIETFSRVFADSEAVLEAGKRAYLAGELKLEQRATLEENIIYCHRLLRQRLLDIAPEHRLLEDLNERLANKLFCNFSVFQSVPDAWGIDQLFPIVPLKDLHKPLTASAVVHDLTCDSDGQIRSYIQHGKVRRVLPVHEPIVQPYFLGIFLVGAYQEILGDMHNLFGDTNSINVTLNADGSYRLSQPEPGDRIDQLLEYVHYDTRNMLEQYRLKLQRANLSVAAREQYHAELVAGLKGYTYLED